MDPEERIAALQKAYADIILNTAKEAAERVMVSERKAQRFEHELKVAKEEALALLLRLKHMMDDKISEAQLVSLSQQQKIEELEAQLQEAEDIVRDLREELEGVQSELKRVKKEKAQRPNDHAIPNKGQFSDMNGLCISQSVNYQAPESEAEPIVASVMNNASVTLRNAAYDNYFSSVYTGKPCCGSPELPSIILRSKEPALYRNGCTQRIRACDRTLMDEELSLTGQVCKMKNEKSVGAGKGNITCNDDKSSFDEPVVQAGNWPPNWSIIKKMSEGERYSELRTPSFRNILDPSRKIDEAPNISCSRKSPISAEGSAHSGENSSYQSPRLRSENGEQGVQTGCIGASESESMNVTIDVLTAETVPQNTDCRGSLEISVSEMNHGECSPPSVKQEQEASETSNGYSGQSLNDRVFKYTFQRKRKRESLNRPDENVPLKNDVSEEYAPVESYLSDKTASLEDTPRENVPLEKSTSDVTSLENKAFGEEICRGTQWCC